MPTCRGICPHTWERSCVHLHPHAGPTKQSSVSFPSWTKSTLGIGARQGLGKFQGWGLHETEVSMGSQVPGTQPGEIPEPPSCECAERLLCPHVAHLISRW